MNRLLAYFSEARIELTKVTWPTRAQAIRWSIVVIIFSIVFAVFIGILDYMFSFVLQRLILKV